MESIDIAAGAYSWRDILLTLGLASVAIFFFFRQSSSVATSSSSTSIISEDQRRERRERLAAIAEERAAAKRLQDQELQNANANNDGIKKHESREKSTSAKRQLDARATAKSSARGTEPPTRDVNAIQLKQSKRECEGEGGRKRNNHSIVNSKDVVGETLASEQGEDKEYVNPKNTDESVEIEDEEECAHDNGNEVTDIKVNHGANDGVDVPVDKADVGKQIIYDSRGMDIDDKANDESTEAEVDNGQSDGNDTDHRRRHAEAIAKIVAKKGERDEKRSTDPSLTVYLMLSSSPGSHKLELSIPTTCSCSELLRRVSKASGVPEEGLKLVFRGRMITEFSTAGHVVDEFDIENGSVLHVVGKPQQPIENKGNDDSEEEGSSDSEESDDSDSEEEVIQFSDVRARAQVMSEIRHSSGGGVFHRAAQRGDLAALRVAVDTGYEDILHVADSNGWTVLHEAVRAGHIDMVEYLISEAGLDVNVVTNQGTGWSPLSLALETHGDSHPVTIMLQTFLQNQDGPPANPWADAEEDDMYD